MTYNLFGFIANYVNEAVSLVDSEAVTDAILDMTDAYNAVNLGKNARAGNINFDDINYRCAYVFRYFTSIVNATIKSWQEFQNAEYFEMWLNSINDQGYANFCSLGGGPGTDLLAFYFFLKNIGVHTELQSSILDVHTGWHNTAKYLLSSFDVNQNYGLGNFEYLSYDFFSSTMSTDALAEIRDADIISIVKFVSCVAHEREFCESRLAYLLREIKPGAIVFCMDNSGGKYMELMNDAAEAADLQFVIEFRHVAMTVNEGRDDFLNSCYDTFSSGPQMTTRVSACLWRKPKRRGKKTFALCY